MSESAKTTRHQESFDFDAVPEVAEHTISSPDLRAEASLLLDEMTRVFPLGYQPKIIWKKMSISAGKAYFERGTISLSTVLITDRLRMQDTLVHEFAHLLSYARHGKKGVGHGEPWRQAMKDLGARPEVYHDYPVERRRQPRNLVYACSKCGESFTRVRPLKRGYKYSHRGCGGSIEQKLKK